MSEQTNQYLYAEFSSIYLPEQSAVQICVPVGENLTPDDFISKYLRCCPELVDVRKTEIKDKMWTDAGREYDNMAQALTNPKVYSTGGAKV